MEKIQLLVVFNREKEHDMMHDIFVPCRLGNYYLHKTRILSIEVTPVIVQGLLLEYSGKLITLKHKVVIPLKDFASQTQVNAIKKIVSTVGTFDEVVTTLSSSAIIFKELELPFLGRETLKMVIPFEVENVLPFALDDAVIDFLVTREDSEKRSSTVLVAAVRKEDVRSQFELFQKADISLHILTVDVFALYRLYEVGIDQEPAVDTSVVKTNSFVLTWWASLRKKISGLIKRTPTDQPIVMHQDNVLHNFQPKRSEVLIDIGFDSIKLLYVQSGKLGAVRVIPFGIADGLQRISQELNVSYYDLVNDMFSSAPTEKYATSFTHELKIMFDEIARTFLYFQQQKGLDYLKTHRIILSGFYTQKPLFIDQAKNYFGSIVEVIDIPKILKKLGISYQAKETISSEQTMLLASCFAVHNSPENNLLQELAQKSDNRILYVQLLVMICATAICIGGTWWRSSQELQLWQTAYNTSKKQFVNTIEQQMGIDLKGEKNLKTMVEFAEDTLKRERVLWFSFMKQHEASILEYLQDLSIAIDRVSLGLDLRQMHLDYEKITMSGSVKSFEALDVFDEELQELKLLTVVEKPRELSWAIALQPKASQKGSV